MHIRVILFDGCSWTWGDELENRKKDRFSTLVSDHLGKDHVNLSERGKSNDGILRTTIEYCQSNTVDLAIIQFTKISRREILDSKGERYIRINVGSKNETSGLYFENLYTHADDIANFYKNKFLLEHFFKVKGIPYYFVCLNKKKDLYKENYIEYLLYKRKPSSWQKMSDTEPVTSLYTLFGGDKKDGTPYFDYPPSGHPNIKGHQKIADHILQNLHNYETML